MKFLVFFLGFLGAVCQLSSASEDITTDKRYPLYHLIATEAYDCVSNQLLEYGSIYKDFWPQYNAQLTPHEKNSENYQETAAAMKQVIAAVKNLENNKEDCARLKDLEVIILSVPQGHTLENWHNTDNVQNRLQQIKMQDKPKVLTALHEIYEKLPVTIENFKQSLNDSERKEFSYILSRCQLFIEAKTDYDKYYHMTDIADVFYKNEHFKNDCRMKFFEDFILQTVVYAIDKQ